LIRKGRMGEGATAVDVHVKTRVAIGDKGRKAEGQIPWRIK